MRFRTSLIPVLALALTSAAFAGRGDKLAVGAPAPGLDIEEWIRGEELALESGNVYIVEFWATWCAPCRGSIPHLSDLQASYGDHGLTVIGISDEDPEIVRPWVKTQGKKMAYTVAVDRRKSTNRAWLQAAGITGIPTAFLVDRKGKIAFIGNPHPKADGDELERVLEKVLRGRYDPELEDQAAPLLKAARDARKTRTWRIATRHYDEVIELNSTVFADVAIERFDMMLVDMDDRAGAYAYAREKLLEGYFTGDEDALRMLAEKIATDPKLAQEDRDLDFSLECAQAAMKLAGSGAPRAQATLALVYFQRGEVADAIKHQKRAWMMAKPKHKSEYQRVLRAYQAADRTAMRGG